MLDIDGIIYRLVQSISIFEQDVILTIGFLFVSMIFWIGSIWFFSFGHGIF